MNTHERHWFFRAMEKFAFVLLLVLVWLAIADIFVKPLVSEAHMQTWNWLGAQIVSMISLLVIWVGSIDTPGRNPEVGMQMTAGWVVFPIVFFAQLYAILNVFGMPSDIKILTSILGFFVGLLSLYVVWES